MSEENSVQATAAPRALGRVLFVSGRGDDDLQRQLWGNCDEVVTAGLGEAMWLWPLSGFDLVLIEARGQPETGIELCRRIKSDCRTQRVALLLGDRSGMLPHRFEADAVVSGAPSPKQLLAVFRLLLAQRPFPAPGEVRKRPVRESGPTAAVRKTTA